MTFSYPSFLSFHSFLSYLSFIHFLLVYLNQIERKNSKRPVWTKNTFFFFLSFCFLVFHSFFILNLFKFFSYFLQNQEVVIWLVTYLPTLDFVVLFSTKDEICIYSNPTVWNNLSTTSCRSLLTFFLPNCINCNNIIFL